MAMEKGSGWSVFVGVLLILAGFAAVVAPLIAGVTISLVLAWIILFAGVMHLIYAWSERGAGAVTFQVLIGLVYVAAAMFLLARPLHALIALTLLLALYIAFEGILELGAYMKMRKFHGGTWFLVDGIISLLLAALILFHFPSSSAWALGTIVGISLMFSGWARLFYPMQGRRLRAII